MHPRQEWIGIVALVVWLPASVAAANGIAADAPPPTHIYNGEQAGICEFPTAVSLGSCTATLVHPELIIYAAHCGSSYGSVFFGNDTDGAGFSVSTSDCAVNPGWGGVGYGVDVAYCTLAEPVTEVPFTPPLMGCEVEVLQPGREVWIVGFGETENGTYGVKHKAQTTFNYTDANDDANIGGGGVTVCFGDSGGPTFVQLREEDGFDGSWRAFGIASYVYTPCGTDGFSAMMHNGVEWVEQSSGVDVTPCHDADGTWNPSERCTGFPAGIDTGAGDWTSGCEPGPITGFGATCGAPFGGGDTELPIVSITAPQGGDRFDLVPGESDTSIHVVIDVQDTGGIAEVSLVVDGTEVASMNGPPFELDVMLPAGAHVLEALAVDLGDNAGHSAQIEIEIGEVADDSDGDDSASASAGDDGNDDDGDAESDDGDPGGDDAGDADHDEPPVLPPGFGLGTEAPGCGCTTGSHHPPVVVSILLLLTRRRRSRG